MSKSPSIETAEDFKHFVGELQRVLNDKNQDLRTLKLNKALHTASEAKDFENWHKLLDAFNSLSQDTSEAATPQYIDHSVLVYITTEIEFSQEGDEPVVETSTFGTDNERLEDFKDRLRSKFSDRDIEDCLNCSSIDSPEEDEVDIDDEEAVFEWILENHGVSDLQDLFSVLDYSLRKIEFESQYVDVKIRSMVPERDKRAKLINVKGSAGREVFSSELFTTDEAKEEYMNKHGVEAEWVDAFNFDTCSAEELSNFASFGNIDPSWDD